MKIQRFPSGRSTLGLACALLLAMQISVVARAQSYLPLYTQEELALMTPTSADPTIALLPPGIVPDYDFWDSARYWQRVNQVADVLPRAFVSVDEEEPNDAPFQAQYIPVFGSSLASGTATGTEAFKLIDATQNFSATVSVGDFVINTTDPNNTTTTMVKDIGFPVESGTATNTVPDLLIEIGQNFMATVNAGDRVTNTIDPDNLTTALVSLVIDNETLELDNNIMVTDDTYVINSDNDTTLILDDDIMEAGEKYEINASYIDADGNPASKRAEIRVNADFQTQTFIQTFVHEDNGSIPLAVQTGLGPREVTATLSRIGDGPHGSMGTQEGDFDYYELGSFGRPLPIGTFIEVDIDTFDNGGTLDTFLILWDSGGNVVDFADSDSRTGSRDAFMSYRVETGGVYYVSVSAFRDEFTISGGPGPITRNFPESPFLSGSGAGFASEGDYNITMRVADVDYVEVDLRAGDVVGVSSVGQNSPVAGIRLEDEGGTLLVAMGTNNLLASVGTNDSVFYPDENPLISDGNAHEPYIIDEDGKYRIAFVGSSPVAYQFDLRAFRPKLEVEHDIQSIYLNFGEMLRLYDPDSGELVLTPLAIEFNPSIYSIPELNAIYPDSDILISPLAIFMGDLGFQIDDPDEFSFAHSFFTSAITSVVESHFPSDVQFVIGTKPPEGSNNGIFDDFAEVIIGGKISETGLETIGISQTIDPGNFSTSEQAIVQMDILTQDLTAIPIFWLTGFGEEIDADNRDRALISLYTTVIGNIVAHEIGHFLGNFHTDNIVSTNNAAEEADMFEKLNIMDAGGVPTSQWAGVGPDGIFNTLDDVHYDFGLDYYQSGEGFTGRENTRTVVNRGVNAGGFVADIIDFDNLYVNYLSLQNGVGTKKQPLNSTQDAVLILNSGGTIHISPGEGEEIFEGINKLDTPMVIRNENPQGGVVRIGGN